jgi:uncharacterized protein involved in response to NO
VLAKGFRLFFLLAAVYAVTIVPLWLAMLSGWLAPHSPLAPGDWHAHEMIHGFALAVIAGFLLTAVGNWTSRETATGAALAALALVWCAGRLALLFSTALPRGVPAVADLAFVPLLAAILARPLLASGNRRNLVMLAVLLALGVTNAVVHLESAGWLGAGAARRANLVAVDVISLLILIIAGRVFPMFTRNATGVASIRSQPWLDRACIAAMALLCVVDALAAREGTLAKGLAGVVAVLAAARALHWGALHSRREPLLWILHAGYFWLVLALLLRGVGGWLGLPLDSVATHALTVGAIGSLTLGMMTRVSLGHTGRMLATPPAMTIAFVAMSFAALMRVLTPWLAPRLYREGLIVSGMLWTAGFAIFLVVFAPVLLAPRVDGKPG